MEKQKPFTLFVPPLLSSSQVSAVKPQTAGGDSTYFKTVNKCTESDFGVSFAMSSLSKSREDINTDPALQKLSILPILEQVANSGSCHYQEGPNDSDFENSEPMSRLYSKLYKEAEKIKKWKVSIESELKQKENKLQENRKIIEAQRKAIQELQFENEKVSLKLEEEIQENKDLIKENNATRHLCNLLKETCARSAEKTNKYEYEREETRQVYVDLNNNIEKMILAFEELRVQAENARLEMHFKLKEDHEKIQHLEEEYKKEVNNKENEVSLLLIQSTEKENKMKELTFLLEESRDKVNQLEKKTKLQDENLKELNEKKSHLTSELEDIKMSLQRSMNTQKALEEDLQIATKTIYQFTEEKEAQMEEFNKAKTDHSFVVTELKATICNLEELLGTEQQRLEKNEDQLKLLIMELQKKSSELDEMTKSKNDKEMELEELKKILVEYQKLLDEKKQVEKLAEELQEKVQELTLLLQTREKEVHDLEVELTVTKTSDQYYSKQVEELKTKLEEEKLKNAELTESCDKLSLENKKLAQETSDMALELKKNQEDITNSKKQEERMLKQIENMEEKETHLRDELESVRKKFIQQEDEVKCKLDKSEENARSIECEVLKKEKQMKILENKCNNLRKQVENKSKYIEELLQENKTLKKKSSTDNKQLNAYEIKVNKLELELESAKQKFQEMTNNYQKELEVKKISEEKLLGEIEKAKATVDEEVKLQKEIDLRCQHKIAEMVALMEKHKHQYDKIVEERDSELGLYKSREQEQSSVKAALETELSNIRSELVSLKKQLEIEREEKEKLKLAKESIAILKDKKDKKIQTSLSESPETTCQKFDSKATPSQKISRISSSMDSGKCKDNRDCFRTSAKNILSTTVVKEYTVKTPTKMQTFQRENKYIPSGGSNKKRKAVFEFDVNSDSSETTDLLSMVSEEETSNRFYNNNSPNTHLFVKTPKQTPLSLSTPVSSVKFEGVRKMREDRWATIAKVDRKRRLKEAEKLFA
uniref:synaptonemal complex protein 1 isoform X1 n=1 Tax=Myodes glareolus TaxID=447135 RepID=UPI00201FDA4E|nr:synaptonemal complex protein 1 isoform X1 [Myodes glareolus]XP_048298177.1 synaptonemal complex protein 1 isoform X1 [Myodes glareolus]XP_048298178.1 synaptonemal complex protein 1 isoform X1 [Myodes glareolus]XP_048298179.1 synaptonemal complex protein 1 isoform X1 [Myodes glareolus]XP_048298180.1 synaptonemal complex protein 1 isoform X1 [Myodes glareolus]